ncbi:alkaline phosphatase [bacterium]|nr:alkaline phosphatase [bacterium]
MMRRIVAILMAGLIVGQLFAKSVDVDIDFYTPDPSIDLLEDVEGTEVKNIILMIGDGMGLGHVAMTRFYAVGANGRLTMERFPVTSFVNTHSAKQLVTDSAAAATAMSTGVKTNNKMISVTPDMLELPTVLELAEKKGLSTGLVATSTVTHATPASFAAHEKKRKDEDKIAADMTASGVDVLMGGGREYFVGPDDSEGKRDDDRDLFREFADHGYDTVTTREGMLKSTGDKLVGLFEYHAMTSEGDEPTLREMTAKALDILSRNENGFFLMVEGSQIDWAAHDNDPDGIVYHTLHFDLAIREALEFAKKDGQTLIIVTADHETGGVTIPKGDLDGDDLDVDFSTGHHTATPVPLFAYGPSAERFSGMMDNTDIAKRIAELLGLEGLEEAVTP